MAAKKRKTYRLQEKSEQEAKKTKAHRLGTEDKGEATKRDVRDDLRQLVMGNDERHILGFSKDVLGIPRLESQQEVLDYMLKSAQGDGTVLYFEKELKEYLVFKKDFREPFPDAPRQQHPDEPQPEKDELPIPEYPDDVPEWEQDMSEGEDALDYMQKHFLEAKERLQNFLDRMTIAEMRIDGHDKGIQELQEGKGEAGTGDVSKQQLAELKAEIMGALKDLEEGREGVGSEYVIKYPDKPDKKLKAVLPNIWPKLMDLATTRSNIFLAGPTQCGKTYTTEILADALSLRYSALSCSEGMDEGIFQGRLLPIGENNQFSYVPSMFVDFYENGGVFLLDEFCASDSNLGVFINNALGNDQFYLPIRHENPLVKKHKDFICIAADNTIGHGGDDMYVGRNQMDASTMERFRTGFLVMDYSAKIEKSLAHEDVYDWAIMIRKAISSLKMNRAMTTRTMKEFTKMKHERQWTLRDMEKIYFADWPKDDVKRVLKWIEQDLKNTLKKAGESSGTEGEDLTLGEL